MRTLIRGIVFVSAFLTLLNMSIGPAFGGTTLVNVGPIGVRPFDVLLVFAVVALLAYWLAHPFPRLGVTGRTVKYAIGLYLCYQLLVVLPYAVFAKGVEPTLAMRLMTPRLTVLFVAFYALLGFRYVSHRTVIGMWNLVGVIVAAYAAYRFGRYGVVGDASAGTFRIRLLGGQAIAGIGWLLIVSPIVLGRHRWVSAYLLPALGLVGLVLVNHRGAYVAFVAVMALHAALHLRSPARQLRLWLAVLALSLAAIVVLSFVPQVSDSVEYSVRTAFNPTADRNAEYRVATAPIAFDFFLHHPLGDLIWDNAISEGGYAERDLPGPENFILGILIIEGLAGLALWGTLLVAGLSTAWRNRRSDRVSEAMLYYIVFFLVYSLTNGAFYGLGEMCLLATSLALVLSRDAGPAGRPSPHYFEPSA